MIALDKLSEVRDCLNVHYNIKAHSLTVIPLGADLNSFVYKAETRDHLSYFVKIKKGYHHHISITILDLLRQANVSLIIPPIATKNLKSFQIMGDFTMMVHPFVVGENCFTHQLNRDEWVNLGKCLKQIHEIKVPESFQQQLRKEQFSGKWRQIVRELNMNLDVVDNTDDVSAKLLIFMKENRAVIEQLVNRAEDLALKMQNESVNLVLCHADIHGGNVLVDQQGNLYIVDWDDPILAPKERDLMFIGGGVANVWNKPDEEKYFYEGYGKTEINREMLSYYRHERIVEDIAVHAQEILLSTTSADNRSVTLQHFLDMFVPRGVVEIAFETDY